jgi:hypothetical protein
VLFFFPNTAGLTYPVFHNLDLHKSQRIYKYALCEQQFFSEYLQLVREALRSFAFEQSWFIARVRTKGIGSQEFGHVVASWIPLYFSNRSISWLLDTMGVQDPDLPSSVRDLVCVFGFPSFLLSSWFAFSPPLSFFGLLQVFPNRLAWILSAPETSSNTSAKMAALRELSEAGDLMIPKSDLFGPDVLYRLDASTLVVFSCRYTPKTRAKPDAYRYLLPPELTWFPTATNQHSNHSNLCEFMKPIKRIIVRSCFLSFDFPFFFTDPFSLLSIDRVFASTTRDGAQSATSQILMPS